MEPEILRKLIIGALVPGALSAVCFLALWLRGARAAGHWAQAWVLETLCAGAPIFAGLYVVLDGFVSAPRSSDQLLPFAAFCALFATVLPGAMKRGDKPYIGYVFSGLAMCIGMATRTNLVESWPAWKQLAVVVASSLSGGVIVVSMISLATSASARLASATMMTIAGMCAQVIVLCLSSLKLGQCAGVVAAMFGGVFAVSLLRPRAPFVGAAGALGGIVLAFTLLQAVLHGEPGLKQAVPVALSIPIGAYLAMLAQHKIGARLTTGALWIVTLGCAAAPAAIAIGVWMLTHAQPADEYSILTLK